MRALLYSVLLIVLFDSCRDTLPVGVASDLSPDIWPDYKDVTIPYNISPLNFELMHPSSGAYAVFSAADKEFIVKAKKRKFELPASQWEKLTKAATGHCITITILAKDKEWVRLRPFRFYVADEPADAYIAYRLIEPGYALWGQMGIYQRDISTFTEIAIMENRLTGGNCMNCHSFCMQNPDRMLFHLRDLYAGTLIVQGDYIEKLDTKTAQTVSPLVYPSWHPSGDFVAFSVNQTKQAYHINHPNRVEVYDEASDVVVYDVKKHEIVTTPPLSSPDVLETFPAFSPDGKRLYYCSAQTLPMPQSFEEVKYSLCAIAFNPETRSFGTIIDTLYQAEKEGKSVSFPRVSPDGKYLMFTVSGYGNFSIWHQDADLYMLDITSGKYFPLEELNSEYAESYHSWSSNSRWVVFGSRRMDGLYTHPYIAYINAEGKASKPFLLPQKDTDFYRRFLKSYNIPEFITGKVKDRKREFALKAKKDSGQKVGFVRMGTRVGDQREQGK